MDNIIGAIIIGVIGLIAIYSWIKWGRDKRNLNHYKEFERLDYEKYIIKKDKENE